MGIYIIRKIKIRKGEEIMALYFNMEKNLLRNGGRKAPIMSETDLMAIFSLALERFKEKGVDYDAWADT